MQIMTLFLLFLLALTHPHTHQVLVLVAIPVASTSVYDEQATNSPLLQSEINTDVSDNDTSVTPIQNPSRGRAWHMVVVYIETIWVCELEEA